MDLSLDGRAVACAASFLCACHDVSPFALLRSTSRSFADVELIAEELKSGGILPAKEMELVAAIRHSPPNVIVPLLALGTAKVKGQSGAPAPLLSPKLCLAVIGAFAEMSSDVEALADVTSSALAAGHT